jgi:hypothetical protein
MKAMRYIALILILVAAGCDNRVHSGPSPESGCINNLRQIAGAKEQWQFEKGKTTNDVPTIADLTNYMAGIPKCPKGGTYTIGPVGMNPTCSIKGHELPASNAH